MLRTVISLLIGLLLPAALAPYSWAADQPPAAAVAAPARAKTKKAPPPSILSIIPSQGEPGSAIVLSGSGFTEKSLVYLSNVEIPAKLLGPEQLTFEIPRLPPGLYALFVKREDGSTSKTYNFSLLTQKPVVTGLLPDTVQACSSGRDREVTVSGRNFLESSRVLFNSTMLKSTYRSSESLGFIVPPLPGGLYQVQVKNAEDAISGILGLYINGRPEIYGVRQGENNVNSYQLIVEGTNFQQNSVLVADGRRLTTAGTLPGDRDRLSYVSCTQLVYLRYPYDTVPKPIQLQVINPNGEESAPYTISAP